MAKELIEGRVIELVVDGSSGSPELELAFAKLALESFEIFKKKQASYGSGNISTFGAKGVFIRMWDKVQRLKRLVWHGKSNSLGEDETIKDTYLDLSNYCLISQMVLQGSWPDMEEE